jgi:hypothetical protein
VSDIDQRRAQALSDLQDILADGGDPAEAIAEVSRTWAIRADIIEKIGARLLAEQDRLILARTANLAAADRKRRADKVIALYKQALLSDRDASIDPIEESVGVSDLSDDEKGTLFLRQIDAWLDRSFKE